MKNKNVKHSKFTDIEHIYKETDFAIIAKVKTVNLGSHLAVIPKKLKDERYYASSMIEAEAICKSLEPIPTELIESLKIKADTLAVQIKEILKDKDVECSSHVYEYNNTDYDYGLPCVKITGTDNTTVFLANSDLRYKLLSKLDITESEIDAIATTLSKYYRKPISIIKDGLRVKTYSI